MANNPSPELGSETASKGTERGDSGRDGKASERNEVKEGRKRERDANFV